MRIRLTWVSAAVLLILLISCSNRDDRNDIRSRYGEPDAKQSLGKDIFWRELWFYNSAGVGYEFRRNAGCGSYHDTYLYGSFYFTPDSSGRILLKHFNPDSTLKLRYESRDGVLAPY